MKHLFLLAMLVLGTGFAQAQDMDKEMPASTDMEMPMDTPDMDMLAKAAYNSLMMYVDVSTDSAMKCKTMCSNKDMMIMDLNRFKRHSMMVLSKKQMMKVEMMIEMEKDMKSKMDMDK